MTPQQVEGILNEVDRQYAARLANLLLDAGITTVDVDLTNNKYVTESIADELSDSALKQMTKLDGVIVICYNVEKNEMTQMNLIKWLEIHKPQILGRLKVDA